MYSDSFVDQDNQDIAGINVRFAYKNRALRQEPTVMTSLNARDVYLSLGVQAGAFNR